MRAFLAMWVVVCHVMWASGYEAAALSGLPQLLRQGTAAVEVFVIISAFVILLLLDTKRLTFRQFIARRFFRLFPLFIVLFLVAIPLSHLSLWNVTHAGATYLSPQHINYEVMQHQSWWDNLHWHVPLHALMLHGTVPQTLLQDSPGAFLYPAWSVSLEWQFYLVAPLAFGLAVSARPSRRIAVCVGCALLFLASRYLLPPVMHGAALPFHLPYFFMGAVSYFIYKRFSGKAREDTVFPVACFFALFLLMISAEMRIKLVPVALWIAFFALILERRTSFSWRLVSSLFTNRIAQFLGRISYSIYLSHILLLVVLQYALLTWAPGLDRASHFWVLLISTTATTIAASIFLYQYLEVPGMQVGRMLANRLDGRQTVTPAITVVPKSSAGIES